MSDEGYITSKVRELKEQVNTMEDEVQAVLREIKKEKDAWKEEVKETLKPYKFALDNQTLIERKHKEMYNYIEDKAEDERKRLKEEVYQEIKAQFTQLNNDISKEIKKTILTLKDQYLILREHQFQYEEEVNSVIIAMHHQLVTVLRKRYGDEFLNDMSLSEIEKTSKITRKDMQNLENIYQANPNYLQSLRKLANFFDEKEGRK